VATFFGVQNGNFANIAAVALFSSPMKSLFLLLIVFGPTLFAADSVPLARAIDDFRHKSQITVCDGPCQPFHIKVSVAEKDSPDSDYKADIEEYWVSPNKWSRTVATPDFSQKVIMNGDRYYESNTGDYDPMWLRNVITALFDPIPNWEQIEKVNAQVRLDGREHDESNVRWQQKIGTESAQNLAFSTITFRGDALLRGIYLPGYGPTFDDFRSFGAKKVPRKIQFDPEPGTEIDATVTSLQQLDNPTEDLFEISQPTTANQRIQTIQVSESTARSLIKNAPDIIWPPVRAGKTHGVLSILISVDRSGKVRETEPMNSDNPQLDDSAREQVSTWQFKTASVSQVPVQFESTITLAFDAKIGNPTPQLSDAEARKQATHIVEANFPPRAAPSGTRVNIVVSVNESGSVIGGINADKLPLPLFLPAFAAARQWQFRPYINSGKPDSFDAHITFIVQ
jgi:TonB family protein